MKATQNAVCAGLFALNALHRVSSSCLGPEVCSHVASAQSQETVQRSPSQHARANSAPLRQSRPDSSLDLSNFPGQWPRNLSRCSLFARQRYLKRLRGGRHDTRARRPKQSVRSRISGETKPFPVQKSTSLYPTPSVSTHE